MCVHFNINFNIFQETVLPPDESNNKITTKSNNEVLDPSTSKSHLVVTKNVEDKLVEDV